MPSETFTVTMLSVLRGPFEEWLACRGLEIAQVPLHDDALIVVPTEALIVAGYGDDMTRATLDALAEHRGQLHQWRTHEEER
jgi:hypothetical protein